MKFLTCLLSLIILTSTATLAFQEISISFSSSPGQPYFIGQPEINIDAEEFTTVILKIKSSRNSRARLFWATNFDPQMNEPKSIEFDLKKGLKEYVFNLKNQNQYWMGFIKQLLIYPEKGPQEISIESATASPGNFITHIKSAWQEFMTFERPLPRTINVILGPKINGISVNTYIYLLIFIISFGYLIYFLLAKHLPGTKIIKELTARVLFACFFFWILLDLRVLVDQVRYAFLNWEIFGGKSLEEKQALATFQNYYDFYYFLKDCQSKLPKRALYRLIVPENYYYYEEKAKYYLYPLVSTTTPEEIPDYLIVYDPQKILKTKEIIPKGYFPFATCGEAGYILKRGKI